MKVSVFQYQIHVIVIFLLCTHTFVVQEEKRFYQLELVNRETNFNKVFSSSPNVGLLNPLQLKVSTSYEGIMHDCIFRLHLLMPVKMNIQ